mmetsp:Transcript_45180/g.59916  ORF Transcript_45180/g.59916 Transcript_45180/m.59916 type:complete len:117 (-) Transcript_45180:85-435(-)
MKQLAYYVFVIVALEVMKMEQIGRARKHFRKIAERHWREEAMVIAKQRLEEQEAARKLAKEARRSSKHASKEKREEIELQGFSMDAPAATPDSAPKKERKHREADGEAKRSKKKNK